MVEDEDAVRRVTCTIFGKRGYQILAAPTGDEALQLALQYRGPIHLLLTDVVMPGMSGRDLMERLGPLRPETRVLFVSGYASDAVVHHGVEEGVPTPSIARSGRALSRKPAQQIEHQQGSRRLYP